MSEETWFIGKAKDDDFIDWMVERHRIFKVRAGGARPPFSTDPVFNQFRFTNVFRDLDRGTRWYLLNIASRKDIDDDLMLWNTIVYRAFNSIETAQYLGLPVTEWNDRLWREMVGYHNRHGAFTGAHMPPTSQGMSGVKVLFDQIWHERFDLVHEIRKHRTVENCTFLLLSYNQVGRFFAHQYAQDLRHTNLLRKATDGETWALAGPGCKRGLQWLGRFWRNDEICLDQMTELRNIANSVVPDDQLPILEVKDIQQSLCEFQKYMKLKTMMETGKRCKARKFDTPTRNLL